MRNLRNEISRVKKLNEEGPNKKKGPNTSYSLKITNALTKEEYIDDTIMIPSGTEVIVRRIPTSKPPPIIVDP